jgi:hypothetical protein
MDPQLISFKSDTNLILNGKADIFGLSSIPEGRIVDFDDRKF